MRKAIPGNREKAQQYSREYHKSNRAEVLEKMAARNRAYYERNRERLIEQACQYQSENSEKRNAYKVQWNRERAKSDPAFKMTLAARRMLHRALGVAGQKKSQSTLAHLGYTGEELAVHIERQFEKGMTWANYGKWSIDHITPLAQLARCGVTDPKIMNALSNLRPLWAKDNMAKSDNSIYLI